MTSPSPAPVTPWRIIRAYLLQREYADTKSLFDAITKHNARYTQKAFHNLLTRSKQNGMLRQPKRLAYALTQKGRGDTTGPEELNLPIIEPITQEPVKPLCPVVPEAAKRLLATKPTTEQIPDSPPYTAPRGSEWVRDERGLFKLTPITQDEDKAGHYMLYIEGRNSPNHIHTTEQLAQAEAERLARKEQRPVFILKAIARVKLADAPVIREELT